MLMRKTPAQKTWHKVGLTSSLGLESPGLGLPPGFHHCLLTVSKYVVSITIEVDRGLQVPRVERKH